MMEIPKELMKMTPYRPGKPVEETKREYGIKEVYKLGSNENPYGPSPLALAAMKQNLDGIAVYSDSAFYNLLGACEQSFAVSRKMISVGNGSNEIIDLLIRILAKPGDQILTSKYAFVAYQVCAEAARVQTVFTPVDDQFCISMAKMDEALELDVQRRIKIVFIPNPNNPTGTLIPTREIELFLQKWKTRGNLLVVVDEAYHDYVRDPAYRSLASDVHKHSNLAVLRTFSKAHGLAGLRVGLIFSTPEIIDVYNRVRIPFNVNELGQLAATAALGDAVHVKRSAQSVWEQLPLIEGELKRLTLPYLPSQGNFIIFDTMRDAALVNTALLKRGIILRPLANYGLPTCLRMTIGKPHENQKAIAALEQAMAEVPVREVQSVFQQSRHS